MRLLFWRRNAAEPARLSAAGKGGAATAIVALGVAIALPLTSESEGLRTRPYWDPARIRSYCYGETENVRERLYSPEECAILLRGRMSRDYAPKVLACLPELKDERRRYVFAALIDASYNAGWAAVCKSPMAVNIRKQQLVPACNALTATYMVDGVPIHGWYASAKNRKTGVRKELPGLVIRRKKEREICITNLVPGATPENLQRRLKLASKR